jgi:hypothetical protein
MGASGLRSSCASIAEELVALLHPALAVGEEIAHLVLALARAQRHLHGRDQAHRVQAAAAGR